MGADLYIKSIYDPFNDEFNARLKPVLAKRDSLGNGTPAFQAYQEVTVEPLLEEYYGQDPTVNGYFRDSYNSTSVLGFLGLSWWNDFKPNTKSEYTPTACKRFIRKLTAAQEPTVQEWAAREYTRVILDEGENSPESWLQYFRDKRRNLIRFFELAIDLNEPIEASV